MIFCYFYIRINIPVRIFDKNAIFQNFHEILRDWDGKFRMKIWSIDVSIPQKEYVYIFVGFELFISDPQMRWLSFPSNYTTKYASVSRKYIWELRALKNPLAFIHVDVSKNTRRYIYRLSRSWCLKNREKVDHEILKRKVISHFFLRRTVAEIFINNWERICSADKH